jgi:hypothetical protein
MATFGPFTEMQANTIECCVGEGCTSFYLNEMSECVTCGAHMCAQHVCGCPIEGPYSL